MHKESYINEGTFVNWVWSGMPKHVQAYLKLSEDDFGGWSGGYIVTLKIGQNEKSIDF